MKIYYENIKRMLKMAKFSRQRQPKITGTDISLYIHIAQFQDHLGNVSGLYYKDAAAAIGIHPEYFYHTLKSLEYHGFIEIYYDGPEGFWDVKILNNEFLDDGDYKKGFLNVNKEILQSSRFHALACSDKIIILHVLKDMWAFTNERFDQRRSASQKAQDHGTEDISEGYDHRRMPITFKAIAHWAGVGKQTAKRIVKRLSKIIRITKESWCILVHLQGDFADRLDIAAAPSEEISQTTTDNLNIDLTAKATTKTGQTEAEVRNVHLIRLVLRLMNIDPDGSFIYNDGSLMYKKTFGHMIAEMAAVVKNNGITAFSQIYHGINQMLSKDIGRISPRRLNYIYNKQMTVA
jgi:DNA-binding MarR family transcriptional regulator